jgi:hypothetical protein
LVRDKLDGSASPLKLAEVAKNLPKPRKQKAAEFHKEIEQLLDADYLDGKVFRYPSGPKGAIRYWARDERHLLIEVALKLGAEPRTIVTLKKELSRVIKGTDGAFIEGLIRDLIGEDRLFEHPPMAREADFTVTPSRGGTSFNAPPRERGTPFELSSSSTGGRLAREVHLF